MTSTHDDSFREIQLSGKALVFLFMATVVILVGMFLMGVQVGRGVLAAKGAPGTETAAATETEPPPPPSSASPGTSTSPATAGEKLSYAERLGSAEPAKEQLKAEATPAPPDDAESDPEGRAIHRLRPPPRSEQIRSPRADARLPRRAGCSVERAASAEPAGAGICDSGRRAAREERGRRHRQAPGRQGLLRRMS